MNTRIFMFTGLSDVEITGNQTLKNGIKYLSSFGYKMKVFTFMPQNYPNLHDPAKIFNGNIEFRRLPSFLSFTINSGRKVKDLIGRRKDNMLEEDDPAKLEVGGYLREYNPAGRLLYVLFLFVFYLPFELIRGMMHSIKTAPDIFYGVNCQGAVVASLLGRLFGKPVITRFHGVMVTEKDLSKWTSRLFTLDEITGLTVRTNAVIVGNDGTGGDRIMRRLNVDERTVRFWMNGLDIDHLRLPDGWSPAEFREELGLKGKRTLLMVSRLSTWKRIDRGIRGIHKLITQHNIHDVILLIAGEGPDRMNLEKLARTLSVDNNVRFLGGVPHKEIAKYYSIADIFLSLYDISNLGNPILEAMYFGLPLVTIDDGSTGHLLKDGINSFLVPVERLEEGLPKALKKLVTEEPLRKKMSIEIRRTFRDKILSWEERMKLEDKLIKSLSPVR